MDEQKEQPHETGNQQVGKTCKQKMIECLFRYKLMFGVLVTLVLLIGIPFLINVLYMLPRWFPNIPHIVTMWSAADVLSYWASLIEASVAALALIFTLIYTRKQIEQENYYHREKEKWKEIRNIFLSDIEKINPVRPIMETTEERFTNLLKTINQLQDYQFSCNTAIDFLNAHINKENDAPYVKTLIDAIKNNSTKYAKMTQDVIDSFEKEYLHRNVTIIQQTVKVIEEQHINSISQEQIAFLQKILDDERTYSNNLVDVFRDYNEKMNQEYRSSYEGLLRLAGSTFDEMEERIEQKADNMLHFWRNPNAHT